MEGTAPTNPRRHIVITGEDERLLIKCLIPVICVAMKLMNSLFPLNRARGNAHGRWRCAGNMFPSLVVVALLKPIPATMFSSLCPQALGPP